MPFEVKCAYRVIIDLIYMQGGRLPDDARYISGHLGCSIRKWKSIRQALIERGKIIVSGEFLTNYRADKEIENLSKLQEKQAENARGPKKNKDLQEPRQRHTEPEPEENPQSPQGGDDPFDFFWNLYPRKVGKEAARKAFDKAAKKAPVSDIMAGLHAQLPAILATEPRFQPHPATWLNQGRWQDEVQKPERKARNLTDAWINS